MLWEGFEPSNRTKNFNIFSTRRLIYFEIMYVFIILHTIFLLNYRNIKTNNPIAYLLIESDHDHYTQLPTHPHH